MYFLTLTIVMGTSFAFISHVDVALATQACSYDSMSFEDLSQIVPKNRNYDIPDMDTADKTVLHCRGTIPKSVPKPIKKVYLYNVMNLITNTKCLFCDKTWSSIEMLLIYETDETGSFHNAAFVGLDMLDTLHIQTRQSLSLDIKTFSGLTNVRTLKFYKCLRLSLTTVLEGLKDVTVLPNLQYLSLEELAAFNPGFIKLNLDNEAMDILSTKPILHINLSNIKGLIITMTHQSPLCDTLTSMNLSSSTYKFAVGDNIPCPSLRQLDLSRSETEKSRKIGNDTRFANVNVTFDNNFYTNITHLHVSRIREHIKDDTHVELYNVAINSDMPLSLKYVDLSRNRIKHLDADLYTTAAVEEINLSHNEMEYISQKTLNSLSKSLKRLNLAHNMLHKMVEKTQWLEFEKLFYNLLPLLYLDLSWNGFTTIPRDMFVGNTNLKKVDLSGNKFTHLSLDTSLLVNLELLDLKDNSLLYLHSDTCEQLEAIFNQQKRSKFHLQTDATDLLQSSFDKRENDMNEQLLRVDLHHNRLSCECDSLPFMSWVSSSSMFQREEDEDYECMYDGRRRIIDKKLTKRVTKECDHSETQLKLTLKNALTILIPWLITFINLVNFSMNLVRRLYKAYVANYVRDKTVGTA